MKKLKQKGTWDHTVQQVAKSKGSLKLITASVKKSAQNTGSGANDPFRLKEVFHIYFECLLGTSTTMCLGNTVVN